MKPFFLALFLVFVTGLPIYAEIETPTMLTILPEVKRLSATYGPENVLVVFDFDNTIAETPTDLGSEVWFTWAIGEIESGREFFPGVTTYDGLIELQAAIFELRPMKLVQSELPSVVSEIQGMKVHAMLETSRNPILYPGTREALHTFGVDFSKTAPGPHDGYKASFSPHAFIDVADTMRWGLRRRPLPVHFEDGLYMTQGQHKGGMLRALFKKIGWQPKAVLFVDDKAHHTASVEEAFAATGIETVTIRYNRMDAKILALSEGDKSHMQRELDALAPALHKRLAEIRCSEQFQALAVLNH